MEFLVLGCNGMAGHVVSLYLREAGHGVVGFARTSSPLVDSCVGDARDLGLVKEIIASRRFDAVVNCIGMLNQAAEDHHEAAVFLNSYLPHFLAEATHGVNTQVIHISTDCVFSGKEGGYTESSLRDGQTFYDRTKALGELEDGKNLTLRSSIVGPDMKRDGIGLLNWFMQQNGTVYGYVHAVWTGQTTLQLAKVVEEAARQRAHGLYNMVPGNAINKYELLKLFNRYIRKKPIEILPQDTFVADKSLIRTKFDGFDCQVPDYETMVADLGVWMRAHRHLYPQYQLI